MKAKQVFTCIFTDTAPNGGGGAYNIDALPATERNLYNAVSTAYGQIVAATGDQPLLLSMCHAPDSTYQAYLSTVTLQRPFVAMIATYPDGTQRSYTTKSAGQVKSKVQALLQGEFGSENGSGTGEAGILCQLFPPLCALGFWPWAAVVAFTTYRTAEAKSVVGRAMWGTVAFFAWGSFVKRGGLQQLVSMLPK